MRYQTQPPRLGGHPPSCHDGARGRSLLQRLSILAGVVIVASNGFAIESESAKNKSTSPVMAQVPTWSQDDLNFFLHGSMSTEVFPEAVLRAFIKTYPELFPTADLSHLGLIPDSGFGWPIGFSRANVKHLGALPAVGINCASCHVALITSGSALVRILGVTSHFDVEAFFGSVLVATFKTSDPANMKKFLAAYLDADPNRFEAVWQKQEEKIVATMKEDSFGANGVEPGDLHKIDSGDVQQSFGSEIDLAARAHSMLKLFHNIRAALHVPDQPPEKAPLPLAVSWSQTCFASLTLSHKEAQKAQAKPTESRFVTSQR